jgi:hypothetical protein
MLIFTHKPCSPDGENGAKIAKRKKEMSRDNENKLEHLLSRRFNTKKV